MGAPVASMLRADVVRLVRRPCHVTRLPHPRRPLVLEAFRHRKVAGGVQHQTRLEKDAPQQAVKHVLFDVCKLTVVDTMHVVGDEFQVDDVRTRSTRSAMPRIRLTSTALNSSMDFRGWSRLLSYACEPNARSGERRKMQELKYLYIADGVLVLRLRRQKGQEAKAHRRRRCRERKWCRCPSDVREYSSMHTRAMTSVRPADAPVRSATL